MSYKQYNVLAIDDDPETLETIKLYLSEIADVTTLTNGKQAQMQVRQRRRHPTWRIFSRPDSETASRSSR